MTEQLGQSVGSQSGSKDNLPITHHEIREKFLGFFERRSHLRIKCSSLIPENDHTLLVINSGMAPLKKYFTGEVQAPATRLTNIQKCVRTNDMTSVGNNRHLTFFEMMGNWSIGDYFKEEGLQYAWDLLVSEFGFDRDRLNVTVYGGDPSLPSVPPDEESYQIWRKIGLPANRIFRLGAEDNFWGPTSITGPCGPCSEAFVDRGSEIGCKKDDCGPQCGCGRFLEIWNTGVFMQYDKMEDGDLHPLPFRSVDAGAGIERFAMVLQNRDSVYETDLLKPVLDSLVTANKLSVGDRDFADPMFRVMTDHLKSTIFMIGDGIYPSNTRREYVVRRLIRRAVSCSRLLGVGDLKTAETVDLIAEDMHPYYPELTTQAANIKKFIDFETKVFSKTLSRAERKLAKIFQRSSDMISGKDAFFLQDSMGLPLEILEVVAKQKGLTVDSRGFHDEMEKQRARSRVARLM